MSTRRRLAQSIEADVLLASRRRCCLCVSLEGIDREVKGQIAHLNQKSSDDRFDNLVFLCLHHHDAYDSQTSQAKGFTQLEVREYRTRLYAENPVQGKWRRQQSAVDQAPLLAPPSARQFENEFDRLRATFPAELGMTTKRWRSIAWSDAEGADLFAYKSTNGADGVCLVERIKFKVDVTLVICISPFGNPGQSISNAVEVLCFQLCEHFGLDATEVIWIHHYDDFPEAEWNVVTFKQAPPDGPFLDPRWARVTEMQWREWGLRPRKRLTKTRQGFTKVRRIRGRSLSPA